MVIDSAVITMESHRSFKWYYLVIS